MKRSEILRLPPGPELDEIACRAAGLGPQEEWWQQVVYRDRSSSGWYKCGGLPKVSTDPNAAHQLAMATLGVGLGWPVVARDESLFVAFLEPMDAGPVPPGYSEFTWGIRGVHRSREGIGHTPMHAAALAVALTQAENQGD